MAVRRLLLGIDAGTSVVKAVLYQMDGTPLAMESTKTKIRIGASPLDGSGYERSLEAVMKTVVRL